VRKEVKKLNKKLLGTILALSLAVIITVAAVVPTLAHGNQSDDGKSDSIITFYGSGGSVNFQLPQGIPSHPTALMIEVYNFDKRSSLGAMDVMPVYIWVPARNAFTTVAIISDNPNPDFFAFAKTLLNNTPVWTPPIMPNLFQVADKELEVQRHGDVLTVNLTVPINITLPASLGGSFTLPPTALEFRGIDDAFKDEGTMPLLPSPPLSGYTIKMTFTGKPAWVRVWIKPWTGPFPITFDGTLFMHVIRTYTPPPAP
jgi:hypothetical protein